MASEIDLRAIARRAVGKVLAARDSRGDVSVHVGVDPGRPQGAEAGERPGPGSSPLVTVSCLSDVSDGQDFVVPAGARVTPLAQEEAFRRGLHLVSEGSRPAARRVVVAGDHGGRALKAEVLASLGELGVAARDLGTHDDAPCDYPDLALLVAREVAEGRAELGVVIDGAGIGSAMAANKVPGVLAANCWDEASARNAREHNHANVLTLGAGHLDAAAAHRVLAAFLSTPVGPGRHARRVDKIRALETRPGQDSRQVPR